MTTKTTADSTVGNNPGVKFVRFITNQITRDPQA